ncbi:TetR/AcrR family transcriptional regulator [Georgenia sp. AZ-5]|uniref:TetR/AcrR family transcriptional regulator n=1 Tax=Georgenia sp. AZ-5 TaxID=3367526 RepID=UPI00375501C0
MSQTEIRRGPGRPRLGSEDKRERILHEAFDLFARRGYSATSLNDVARAADISKAGLLHHFESKEALFSAVLERRDAADMAGMEAFDGDVWAFLDLWVDLVERNAGKPGMVGLYTAMAIGGVDADHPAHPWLHHHFLRAIDQTAEHFERGKVGGVVAPDAPSRELARTLVALSDGIQLQWLCARADAAAAGEGYGGTTPVHGETPLDMAAQMRLLVDLIKARWAAPRVGAA